MFRVPIISSLDNIVVVFENYLLSKSTIFKKFRNVTATVMATFRNDIDDSMKE